MPTEKELLRRTVEDLKEVHKKNWRYFKNGDIEGFSYTPSLMHVNVCHEVARLDKQGFYVEVEDIESGEKKEYRGAQARNLYDPIDEQLKTISVILPPGFDSAFPKEMAEKAKRESMLERLMTELKK